jgi:hypothetical protein
MVRPRSNQDGASQSLIDRLLASPEDNQPDVVAGLDPAIHLLE